MITIQQARRLAWKEAGLLPAEKVDITASLDRVLAEDIKAGFSIPPFDRSAMDGFALISGDTRGASGAGPAVLKVAGEIKAGERKKIRVTEGRAVSIMTGALMPSGADCVVKIEDASQEFAGAGGPAVKIFKQASPGENVAKKGEDIRKGKMVLRKGRVIDSSVLGMLAYLGREKVKVYRRPGVAVVSTGNEIKKPGERLGEGEIYDANGYLLYGQVIKAGGRPSLLGVGMDEYEKLSGLIREGLSYDVLVISGGVSVGKYDLVAEALKKSGVRMVFWNVAVKPGKPTFFGKKGRTLVFGLPGYPASAYINFENIVKVAVSRMTGRKAPERIKIPAILREPLENRGGRDAFLRVNVLFEENKNFAIPCPSQKSGVLTSVTDASGLIHLKKGARFRKGQKVIVELLEK